MNFKKGDIVALKRKHLYWVLQGSHTLNAVVDSTQKEAEDVLRAQVLEVRPAPRWGNLLILAVENEVAPKDAALAAIAVKCEKI